MSGGPDAHRTGQRALSTRICPQTPQPPRGLQQERRVVAGVRVTHSGHQNTARGQRQRSENRTAAHSSGWVRPRQRHSVLLLRLSVARLQVHRGQEGSWTGWQRLSRHDPCRDAQAGQRNSELSDAGLRLQCIHHVGMPMEQNHRQRPSGSQLCPLQPRRPEALTSTGKGHHPRRHTEGRQGR